MTGRDGHGTGPRLSVVLPVWNGERFLDEAIESILGQDYRDLELIAIDDASTDSTPEILSRWAGKDGRLRVIRNRSNLDAAASRNVGIEAARGVYIAAHDADDVSLPGRFSAEVTALDADPRAVMVTMNFVFIDEQGRYLRTERRDQPPEIVDLLLTFTNAIGGHSQVMFRRDAARRVGGYDPACRFSEDLDLWTRLAAEGRIVMLPQPGIGYRLHAAQKSTARLRDEATRAHVAARSRRLLSAYAGRDVDAGEVEALINAWERARGGWDGAKADALLRELARVLGERHQGDTRLTGRFRTVVAARLAVSAAVLLTAGKPASALSAFFRAARWNVLAATAAPLRQAADSAMFRVRAWRGKRP